VSETEPSPDPAEERVAGYLATLRDDAPGPGDELTSAIVRRARWQNAVRTPLRAVGSLAGALGEGVALLTGLRRRNP
jgi:hypothetical protein